MQFNRNKQNSEETPIEQIRVRVPRNKEVIGIIEQRVGAGRMIVKGLDGVSRNCRIPGRMKKKLWLRENDMVLVEPWEFDSTKGDVIFKYTPAAINWLKKKGFLKNLESEF